MLEETLLAVAAAAGTAVAEAAGTDAWTEFRGRVARWFGRGNTESERTVLEHLDQTAAALQSAGENGLERARIRQEASWETRFVDFLESLDEGERDEFAARLSHLVQEQTEYVAQSGRTSASGERAAAVDGDANIHAEGGSAAALTMGDVTMGLPSPDPS